MRRKIMAGVATAAFVAGGTLAFTATPAEAVPVPCKILRIYITLPDGSELVNLCVL